jgi:hypothetical protein
MGLRESQGKIAMSYRDLMRLWDNVVRPTWQDANAKKVEDMLHALDPDVKDAVKAMEQMSTLLENLKRECGNEE